MSRLITYCKANPLYTILGLTAIVELLIAIFIGPREWPDSGGYYEAGDNLLRGEMDMTRTPVYPALFAFAQLIAPGIKLWIVGFLQNIAFFVSIICFFKTAREIKCSMTVTVVATCIYIFSSQILSHNMGMVSEPLTVSLGVYQLYFFIKWLRANKWKYFSGNLAMSVLLLFTRPSFVYLIIAFAILAVIFLAARHYRRSLQMLACCAVMGSLLYGYCKIIESKIGVLTPSTVTIINEYAIADKAGYLKPENITDPEIKQRAIEYRDRNYTGTIWYDADFHTVNYKQYNNELKLLKGNLLHWWITAIKVNISGFLTTPVVTFIGPRHLWGLNMFLTFWQLCIILAVMAVVMTVYSIRRRTLPIFSIFLWLMCMGNIAVNLLGSFAEWSRLFMPSVPLFILLCAGACTFVRFKYRSGYLA